MTKEDKIFSRICEIQLCLTTKIIEGRKNNYRPSNDDEDQPLRDELLMLRKKSYNLKVNNIFLNKIMHNFAKIMKNIKIKNK
jgi:hypothetical protein